MAAKRKTRLTKQQKLTMAMLDLCAEHAETTIIHSATEIILIMMAWQSLETRRNTIVTILDVLLTQSLHRGIKEMKEGEQ